MMLDLGKRLRAHRIEAGLTQSELAEKMGLRNARTVSRIERGKRKLKADELVGAAAAFEVSLEEFTDPFRLVGEGQFTWRVKAEEDEDPSQPVPGA